MRKPSHHSGAVRVTDYNGMTPPYLYTSLPQDETADAIEERAENVYEERAENVYEEIPADGWFSENDEDTSEYPEIGVVQMEEYEEIPVTYHGPSVCDDEKMCKL